MLVQCKKPIITTLVLCVQKEKNLTTRGWCSVSKCVCVCVGTQPEGSGFVGYYVRNGHELHTGHSSSLATWFEAQRQLADPQHTHTKIAQGCRCVLCAEEKVKGVSGRHDNAGWKEANRMRARAHVCVRLLEAEGVAMETAPPSLHLHHAKCHRKPW